MKSNFEFCGIILCLLKLRYARALLKVDKINFSKKEKGMRPLDMSKPPVSVGYK